MKTNNRQLDAFGVPVWIGESCNQHKTLRLSDTRTYRLLMVIYRSIFEMNASTTAQASDHDEELEGFFSLFFGLGSSISAWLGLMWIYQGIGQKVTAASCGAIISEDERLSRLLMAFIALTEGSANDPTVEHFYNLLGEGWESCSDEGYKDSLYRGFVATLLAQARHELIAVGEERGFPEPKTKEALLSAAAHFAESDR